MFLFPYKQKLTAKYRTLSQEYALHGINANKKQQKAALQRGKVTSSSACFRYVKHIESSKMMFLNVPLVLFSPLFQPGQNTRWGSSASLSPYSFQWWSGHCRNRKHLSCQSLPHFKTHTEKKERERKIQLFSIAQPSNSRAPDHLSVLWGLHSNRHTAFSTVKTISVSFPFRVVQLKKKSQLHCNTTKESITLLNEQGIRVAIRHKNLMGINLFITQQHWKRTAFISHLMSTVL